ncbi:MAG TPA: Fe-Mn family superoxide dismutase [Gammaproteobacteria bacterium]|nr:Fe-Mn family superoxide dismutase [Gammaproteobacteria bacterium]
MQDSRKPAQQGFDKGRRRALQTIAGAATATMAAFVKPAGAAPLPPKETGLSYEGLLKDRPGFQPRTPAPLPVAEIPGFLSKAQLAQSYAVYRQAFAKLLEAEKALENAPRDTAHAPMYLALRTQQLLAANSVLLHELYFRNLARAPVEPSRYILSNMTEHMGALDSWREDFTACARVAAAWAVLAYDPYDDRWHNLPLSEADAGGMAGSNPLVVCAVSDDAWSLDYKDRETYIAEFMRRVDWNAVAARYRAVDRH